MKRKKTFDSIDVNKSQISVFQLNCQKSVVPTSILGPLLLDHPLFIAIISEPPLKRSDSRVDGFCHIYSSFYTSGDGPPRAAIITSQCFTSMSSILHHFSNIDLITVRFDDLVISSLYWHQDSLSLPREFYDLIDWCISNSLKLLLCGDFNAHHALWGSTSNSRKGHKIFDLINDKDLILLNHGNSPTWSNRRYSSIIDLSLCSSNMASTISDWKVSDLDTFSDHNLITFTLNKSKRGRYVHPTIEKSFINYDKVNENLMLSLPNTDWHHQASNLDDLNYKMTSLHQTIENCIDKAKSKHFFKKKIPDALWWNDEIESCKKELLKANSSFKQNKSDELYAALKEARLLYFKSIKKGKHLSFQDFCSNRDKSQAAKLIKQLEQEHHNVRMSCPSIVNSDGKHFPNDNKALSFIINSLTPGKSFNLSDSIPKSTYTGIPSNIDDYICLIREVETICSKIRVNQLLDNTNFKSASGPDNISYKLLSECWDELQTPLRYIFMDCLILGTIPDMWLSSSGIFIPKLGIKQHTLPKHYRSINLTSCLLKCFEKLIIWYFEIDLNLDSFLHPLQFGFRKSKSCDHAISNLVTKIEESLVNREIALGIFMDISGAFDNVSTDFILKVIHDSPITPAIYNIIKYLLNNRRVTYSMGKCILIHLLEKGFAQGGRLSPTLWNLVADGLIKHVNMTLSEFLQALADDIASLITGQDIISIRHRAQIVINAIQSWCCEAGLQINTEKSYIVIFTHRKKISLDLPLTYLGCPLPVKSTVKYLGVHLDSKLSWNSHLRNRIISVNIQQSKLKQVAARHWGLNPATTSWIYKSLTRPKLLYGCLFWANSALQYQSNNIKVNKICRTAARTITGSSKYSPLTPTSIVANIEPIDLSIKRAAIETYSRITELNPNPPSIASKGKLVPHSQLAIKMRNEILSIPDIDKSYQPFYNIDRKFNADTSMETNLSEFQISPNTTLIFTDGSKTEEGSTGSGWVIFCGQNPDNPICEKIRISDHSTVYQAEIFAIYSAANYMIQKPDQTYDYIHFFTDSMSSLHSLTDHHPSSKMVINTIKALETLCLSSKVTLHWVRGHSGVTGNELADKLAKEATHLETVGMNTPAPPSFLKNKLKNWSFKQSTKTFESANTSNKLSKLLLAIHCPESSSFLMNAKTSDLHKLTNILSNRAPLNCYLFKIRKSD